jgi:hypothetical protein
VEHLVFFSTSQQRDAESAKRLAEALGVNPADARLLLGSRFPRRLSAHADVEPAYAVVEKLRAAGFDGLVLLREELAPPAIVIAGAASLADDSVEWTHVQRDGKAPNALGDIRDRVIRQGREHVKAVFLGYVRGMALHETYEDQTVHVPLPGISLNITASRKTGTWSEQDKQHILLVKGRGHGSFLLVAEAGFDYSCLGAERTYSSAMNLRRLATRLQRIFPDARHDDSLLQFPGDAGSKVRSGSASDGEVKTSSSNFEAVLQMARLLAIQYRLE